MKRQYKIALLTLTLLYVWVGYGQKNVVEDYNRSSLYTITMLNPSKRMSEEIHNAYWDLPTPDKYNNHDLALKMLFVTETEQKLSDKNLQNLLQDFIVKNQIAKRMVAKWFQRNKEDGSFQMELIQERGNYNATQEDLRNALQSVRGKAMLADAGEQLIGNTFLIVNDIRYIDKEEKAQKAAAIFAIIGAVAGAATGGSDMAKSIADLTKSVADLGKSISDIIAGFTVNIESHLYRLEWNDEIANTFYQNYYFAKNTPDSDKKAAFERDNQLFKLKYVGSYATRSAKTVARGLHDPNDVFKKVLARAIDNNIVELQKKFPEFKVTTSLYAVENDQILAQIGLKEGVSANSKYEVLERREDAESKISYRRVGVIKPAKNKIWDNRFMAVEEGADNASLAATTFEVVSGSGFYPGMLIREIK